MAAAEWSSAMMKRMLGRAGAAAAAKATSPSPASPTTPTAPAPAPAPALKAAPAAAKPALKETAPAPPPPPAAPPVPSGPAVPSPDGTVKRGEVTLTKELGRSRMGAAYLAVYGDTKVSAKELAGPFDLNKRREVDAELAIMRRAGAGAHANIALFDGAVVDDRGVLIVTELGDLGVLQPYLVANPKMDLATRFSLCMQILRGMVYLHGLTPTVLHRTLSARSVQVVKKDGAVVAKISDFGLARMMPRAENGYDTPKSAVPPRSSAPEVIGARTFYKGSDVWSYGVTLWEIYSNGDLPYSRDVTDHQVMELVAAKKLALMQPDLCPTAVWALIKPSCLAYQAHERRTFPDLAERLKALAPSS